MNPPRTGRPPLDDPRSEQLPRVRVTVGEHEEIVDAAEVDGEPHLSVWMRARLLEAARRTNAKKPPPSP